MNNFTSVFEELSKLYEEEVREEAVAEEKAKEACNEELTEAADDEIPVDEVPADEVPAEEPAVEEEPRQVICECDKCGALVIKDEADIVVDEETDLVNVEEECQFCEEAKGYKIVGVVAPYEAVEEEAADAEEVPVEDEAPVEESVETPAEATEATIDEDLADLYRKTFDKPASIRTQQAWEDELNGEMGEISDKRRKHLEKKFAQQREWEANHPDQEVKY
jgi:hypothetical protein